jgi:hypothetical protein
MTSPPRDALATVRRNDAGADVVRGGVTLPIVQADDGHPDHLISIERADGRLEIDTVFQGPVEERFLGNTAGVDVVIGERLHERPVYLGEDVL